MEVECFERIINACNIQEIVDTKVGKLRGCNVDYVEWLDGGCACVLGLIWHIDYRLITTYFLISCVHKILFNFTSLFTDGWCQNPSTSRRSAHDNFTKVIGVG